MSTRSETKRHTRALVLGGGGPVGRAWQAGLASALRAKGVALDTADLILGTSAGAIVGAHLALGMDLAAPSLPGQRAPTPASGAANGMAQLIKATAAALRTPNPEHIRQAIGQIALTAETPSEIAAIARLGLPANAVWPDSFRATAVNVRSGESIVWRAGMGASLDRAVASSCSLPGVWPPISIDGERYMDGGIRSVLNADLAAGHSAVIVVSCFALALPEGYRNDDQELLNARLNADIAALRAEGAQVDVITPSQAFLTLTEGGTRMLDLSLAGEAFQCGAQQALVEVPRLDSSWHQS